MPQIIESFSLVAPLGLCFHDTATGERIGDGLRVEVYPVSVNHWKKRTKAFPNRSGVYVLQQAYGLENFPFGKGDAEFWTENPPNKTYIVEVFDELNRFQLFSFSVELPVRGILQWESIPVISPSKNLFSIPLYSSATRSPLAGMSVIRASLFESDEKPASFAVLEARFEGELIARGIADRNGQIALIFPSLSPQNNPIVSPPAQATRISLANQNWNLDFSLKYQPNIFVSSPNFNNSNEDNFPDLSIVLAQENAILWANTEKTEELTTAVLQFGKELILRSSVSDLVSPSMSETVFSSNVYVSPAI
ncbi:MAG TPA: hypothetical protein PKY59_25985 [Pyrinomonadaceae bacterium]|nr:hypothetical protein [Pyrinomonadaceae bacterium]